MFDCVIVWWMIWCPIYSMGYMKNKQNNEFTHFVYWWHILHDTFCNKTTNLTLQKVSKKHMILDKFSPSQSQRRLQYEILMGKEVANFTQKLRRVESLFLVTVPECCKTALGFSVCLSLISGKLLLISQTEGEAYSVSFL